jgi:putative methyltransferase (TIGR04325 family)
MNRLEFWLLKESPLAKRSKGRWFGIFPSFSAALAAIPASHKAGWNQDEAQEHYEDFPLTIVRPADYAVLMHLKCLAKPGGKLIDLGGNIGMAYYTTLKYFELPAHFQWIVCDVPKVVEAGRTVAQREAQSPESLQFVTDVKMVGSCDIFLTSGTLQCIETPLADLLKQMPSLPPSLIINRIPVWDREQIVTLNDLRFAIWPYTIFNRSDFLKSIRDLGYRLIDDWQCPESTFSVRFKRGTRLNAYQGFHFEREA